MIRKMFAITLSLVALALPVIIFAPTTASAQSFGPEVFLTWQALDSYAPPGYLGKILPNQQSEILASLEVISNGKPVNLSGQTIYWYQNENLLGGGIGVQHFIFRPYGQAPTTITLKVDLPDYPTGDLVHETNIPIVVPQAVIEAAYPNGRFSASPAMAQAIPYFFAVTSTSPLSFSWLVNGQAVTSVDNPQSLQISLPQSTPAGFAVALNLMVQNSIDLTSANANANLTYSPTP